MESSEHYCKHFIVNPYCEIVCNECGLVCDVDDFLLFQSEEQKYRPQQHAILSLYQRFSHVNTTIHANSKWRRLLFLHNIPNRNKEFRDKRQVIFSYIQLSKYFGAPSFFVDDCFHKFCSLYSKGTPILNKKGKPYQYYVSTLGFFCFAMMLYRSPFNLLPFSTIKEEMESFLGRRLSNSGFKIFYKQFYHLFKNEQIPDLISITKQPEKININKELMRLIELLFPSFSNKHKEILREKTMAVFIKIAREDSAILREPKKYICLSLIASIKTKSLPNRTRILLFQQISDLLKIQEYNLRSLYYKYVYPSTRKHRKLRRGE
jgi:hypothetical protein